MVGVLLFFHACKINERKKVAEKNSFCFWTMKTKIGLIFCLFSFLFFFGFEKHLHKRKHAVLKCSVHKEKLDLFKLYAKIRLMTPLFLPFESVQSMSMVPSSLNWTWSSLYSPSEWSNFLCTATTPEIFVLALLEKKQEIHHITVVLLKRFPNKKKGCMRRIKKTLLKKSSFLTW